ncbi:hypothetical protein CN173_30735 [Sinorhizobium meliloti]|nr:hypothetical protein CN173_30735 [Sinorhizobium meliloti]
MTSTHDRPILQNLTHTTDFTALPQVPRHLGSRRGWDGPPGSRRVAVLRCKLSKSPWSLLR